GGRPGRNRVHGVGLLLEALHHKALDARIVFCNQHAHERIITRNFVGRAELGGRPVGPHTSGRQNGTTRASALALPPSPLWPPAAPENGNPPTARSESAWAG